MSEARAAAGRVVREKAMPPPCRSFCDAQGAAGCDVRHPPADAASTAPATAARPLSARLVSIAAETWWCVPRDLLDGAGVAGWERALDVFSSCAEDRVRWMLVGSAVNRVQGAAVDPGDVHRSSVPTRRTRPLRRHSVVVSFAAADPASRTPITSSAPSTSRSSRRPTGRCCSGGGSSRAARWRSLASAPTSTRRRCWRRWARRCGYLPHDPVARTRATRGAARGAGRHDPLARARRARARGPREVRGQRAGRAPARRAIADRGVS